MTYYTSTAGSDALPRVTLWSDARGDLFGIEATVVAPFGPPMSLGTRSWAAASGTPKPTIKRVDDATAQQWMQQMELPVDWRDRLKGSAS